MCIKCCRHSGALPWFPALFFFLFSFVAQFNNKCNDTGDYIANQKWNRFFFSFLFEISASKAIDETTAFFDCSNIQHTYFFLSFVHWFGDLVHMFLFSSTFHSHPSSMNIQHGIKIRISKTLSIVCSLSIFQIFSIRMKQFDAFAVSQQNLCDAKKNRKLHELRLENQNANSWMELIFPTDSDPNAYIPNGTKTSFKPSLKHSFNLCSQMDKGFEARGSSAPAILLQTMTTLIYCDEFEFEEKYPFLLLL